MRILQINTKYSGGGAANIANSLHKFINENTENQSTFLYGRGESNDPNSFKINNNLDVYFSAFSMRFVGESKNLYFNKQIEDFIRDTDIIHLHNLHGYYINYEKLIDLLVKYKKPVVWTFHDMWPVTGRCAYPYECEKWMGGCYKCTFINTYPKTYIDKSKNGWKKKNKIFNKLDKNKTVLISPSEWLANMLRKSYIKNYNIEVIPNGIKRVEIKKDKRKLREGLNLPIDKKIILFVAADVNDKRKGIKYILEILNDFANDILFLSIGKEMKNIKTNKLKQMGYISDKELLSSVYRASDIFIIPSLSDNFPTTVLEAFAQGLPVVGFNIDGIREQVGNNCGILVEKGNSQELKYAINKLIYNEELIRKFSSNALKKYEENYIFDKFAERYLNVYKKLIDRS